MKSFLRALGAPDLAEKAAKSALSQEELQARMKSFIASSRIKTADRLSVRFAQDPTEGPMFDAWHNAPGVLRAGEVIDEARRGKSADVRGLARKVDTEGGFFMQYEGETRNRIQDLLGKNSDGSGWIVAACDGHRLLKPAELLYAESKEQVGHGDFQLPADSLHAEPVFPILKEGDKKDPGGIEILRAIEKDPAIAMLIADICSYPGFRGAGVAGFIEDSVVQHVREKVNPQRQRKLQFAVSAIANVRGVLDENARPIMFFTPSLLNLISLIMHTRRKGFYGQMLGTQYLRSIPIVHEGRSYTLLADWFITAQPLEQQQ